MVKRAWLLALIATVTVVAAAPSPSMAASDDFLDICGGSVMCYTGAKVSAPTDYDNCATTSSLSFGYTTICVRYYGDIVWVRDGAGDGHSALGMVSSPYSSIKQRWCRNPHGHGSWAMCNWDWSESDAKSAGGGVRRTSTNYSYARLWGFSGG